jgi:MFS transporter, Spinster family, sphingosine-1-phosphate transporter
VATDMTGDMAPTPAEGAAAKPAALSFASSLSTLQQWWLVATLGLLMTLYSIDRQILSLLIQPIKVDLQLTDTQVSLLLGMSYALVHTIVIIPSGWAADRWVRRKIIAFGVVSWSTMTMVCGLTTSYWQLFAARAGVGITEATIEPSAYSMVRDGVAPERRGRAFAVLGMATMIGMALAMISGGLLMGVFSRAPLVLPVLGQMAAWKSVLIVIGAVGIPLALLMATVKEPRRQALPKGPNGEAARAVTWKDTARHLGANWTIYVPVIVFLLAHGIISSSFGAWIPSILIRVWGYTPLEVGTRFGMIMLLLAPTGAFLAGFLIDQAKKQGMRSGLPLIAVLCTIAIMIPAVVAPIAPSELVFWSIFPIQTFTAAMPIAVGATLIARCTPGRLMGKVISLRILMLGLVAQTLAPTLVALIGDNVYGGDVGGPRAIAYGLATVSAAAGTAALVAAIFLWRNYVKRVDLDD